MSYCRFQNTFNALRECENVIDELCDCEHDETLSNDERVAMSHVIQCACDIVMRIVEHVECHRTLCDVLKNVDVDTCDMINAIDELRDNASRITNVVCNDNIATKQCDDEMNA